MTTERVELELIELRHEKPTEKLIYYFEFRDKSIKWAVRMYADHPVNNDDLDLGWKNNFKCIEFIALKSWIAAVGKSYHNTIGVWSVYIQINGIGEDVQIYFKRESAANDFFDKVDKYLHND